MLRAILNEKNMSLYKLEKSSLVSHATLNDIYNEKTNINNCTISIMSKIANALDLKIEDLYRMLTYDDISLFAYSEDFDLFKSNTLQYLKNMDEVSFIARIVSSKEIENYFLEKKYLESLYLLSLIDYLSNKNSIPLLEQYNHIRDYKCKKIYVSKSIYLLLMMKQIKVTEIYKNAIKEFLNHNIIEAEIENVA